MILRCSSRLFWRITPSPPNAIRRELPAIQGLKRVAWPVYGGAWRRHGARALPESLTVGRICAINLGRENLRLIRLFLYDKPLHAGPRGHSLRQSRHTFAAKKLPLETRWSMLSARAALRPAVVRDERCVSL